LTFRSWITTAWFSRQSRVVSLCMKSALTCAMRGQPCQGYSCLHLLTTAKTIPRSPVCSGRT
jgi:hypothetical protein